MKYVYMAVSAFFMFFLFYANSWMHADPHNELAGFISMASIAGLVLTAMAISVKLPPDVM